MAVDDAGIDTKIRSFANAHRRALEAGDSQLTGVEQAILLTLVTNSVVDTYDWVISRVPNGDQHAAQLADLVGYLRGKDKVGGGLRAAQQQFSSLARQAVKTVVKTGAAPLWATTVLAFFAGAVGFTFTVGSDIGGALAFLFVVTSGVLIAHPPARYAALRGLGMASQAAGSIGQSVKEFGTSTIDLLKYPTLVGQLAEDVFRETVGADAQALRGGIYVRAETERVLRPLRVLAGLTIYLSAALLVVGIGVLIGGIYHGFFVQASVCAQAGADCGAGG